jgi:predicted nucleic acid-binding protein
LIYADTSLVVSLYTIDAHSAVARRRMSAKPAVWLTPFNRVEFVHALQRQVFRTRIASGEAARAWRNFEEDCVAAVWIVQNLPGRIWETTIDLARQYGSTLGVRTLDSLHVACALELGAERFWTFDERQERLAQAAGLDTTG